MSDKVNVFGDANVHFDETPEARYHPPKTDRPRPFIALVGPAAVSVTVWVDNRVATTVTSNVRTRGAAYLTIEQAEQTIEQLQRAVEQARSYAALEEVA